MSSPARFLLFVLLAIVGVKLSEQVYGLVAFRDERALARELRVRLVESGTEVVVLRARHDSLKAVLAAEDRALEGEHRRVRWLRRSAGRGLLTPAEYDAFSAEIGRYNEHVFARNRVLHDLHVALDDYGTAYDRYDALADSIQSLAVRMKQPYYQVPTPLEAAAERQRGAP